MRSGALDSPGPWLSGAPSTSTGGAAGAEHEGGKNASFHRKEETQLQLLHTASHRRDDDGRLYAAFATGAVRANLAGLEVLLDEERVSASSKKVIHRIVARRANRRG